MKKAKSFLAMALALAIAAGLFAGCSSGKTSGTTSGTASGQKVELTFWHTWGAGPGLNAMQKVVDNYNAENKKNIHVNLDYVASQASGNTQTMDKLMASIAAGSPPEIALLDNFQVPSWAAQGALVPLDSLMKPANVTLNGIYSWAQAGGKYKNSTYSLPYNGDARALFYNKDLFKAAGLDPNSPPSTIAELEADADKLTIKNGSTFKQVGFIPWLAAGKPIYTWGWSFGGDFYDSSKNVLTISNAKNIEALQWETNFASKYGLKDFVNFASGLGSNAQDPFITGQVAMAVRGNFDIATIAQYAPNLNYGITAIPSKVKGENITWCGGWGLTIPKGAKYQSQSMDFLAYAIGDEAQTTMAKMSGSLAVKQKVNESVFGSNKQYETFMTMLPKAKIRPPVPVGQQVWDGMNNALDSALHQKDTPENLLKSLDTSMNTELKKYN